MTRFLTKIEKAYEEYDMYFDNVDAYIDGLMWALNAAIFFDTHPERFEDESSDDARKVLNGPEKSRFPIWMTEV